MGKNNCMMRLSEGQFDGCQYFVGFAASVHTLFNVLFQQYFSSDHTLITIY